MQNVPCVNDPLPLRKEKMANEEQPVLDETPVADVPAVSRLTSPL